VNEGAPGRACEIPARRYSLLKLGRQREGPGRENSLSSLDASPRDSLSYPPPNRPTRPVFSITLGCGRGLDHVDAPSERCKRVHVAAHLSPVLAGDRLAAGNAAAGRSLSRQPAGGLGLSRPGRQVACVTQPVCSERRPERVLGQDRRAYGASAYLRRSFRFYVLRGLVMCKKCGKPMAGSANRNAPY
jgi:hypothetical protein